MRRSWRGRGPAHQAGKRRGEGRISEQVLAAHVARQQDRDLVEEQEPALDPAAFVGRPIRLRVVVGRLLRTAGLVHSSIIPFRRIRRAIGGPQRNHSRAICRSLQPVERALERLAVATDDEVRIRVSELVRRELRPIAADDVEAVRREVPQRVPVLGDVRDPESIRALGSERAVNEVLGHPDPGNPDRGAPPPAPDQATDARGTHQALHALAPEALAVGEHELDVDARRPIDATEPLVDLGDPYACRA